MKKVLVGYLILTLLVCFAGCKDDNLQSNSDILSQGIEHSLSPEEVASTNIESWFENDFETYLNTYPIFRLKKRASYYVDESVDKTDTEAVAEAMQAEYNSDGREVEILNAELIEQQEFTDYTIYNDLKEEYYDLTLDEFKTITETAIVKINYALEDVVLEEKIKCIKMNDVWYVLEDMAFTN